MIHPAGSTVCTLIWGDVELTEIVATCKLNITLVPSIPQHEPIGHHQYYSECIQR